VTAPGAPGRCARVVTVGAVLLVAAVAAIVSYAHMQEVADRAGEGWRAWLLPLSVDGLVVAASMVLLTGRRAALPGGRLAWCALLGGVGASLAANVAAAEPNVTARVVAAWPALAFAVAFELLLQQRRVPVAAPEGHQAPIPEAAAPAAPEPVAVSVQNEPVVATPLPAPEGTADLVLSELALPAVRTPEPEPTPEPAMAPAAPVPDVDLPSRIAVLVREAEAAGQAPPGRRRLAATLGVTEHAIRTATAGNGAAPEEVSR